MISVPDSLPDDPVLLKQMLLESYAARACEQSAARVREQEVKEAYTTHIDDLKEQIKLWRDRFFGHKSEQILDPNTPQLAMFNEPESDPLCLCRQVWAHSFCNAIPPRSPVCTDRVTALKDFSMCSIYKFSLTLLTLWLLNLPVAAANNIEGNAMNETTWITNYFGRFEIALPKGSEISADYKLLNEKLELVSKNGRINLPVLVNQKTEELKKGIARGTSSRYEKNVSLDNGSTLLLSRLGDFYTFNVYLLSNKNTLYHLMAKTISEKSIPGGIEKMRLLSNAIFFRPPHDAPPPGGFAIEAGYTTLPNDKFFESVYMGAQISGYPGTYISFLTKGILKKEPTLLQRFDNHEYDSALNELPNSGKMRILRKLKRTLGDLSGEEVAISTTLDGKQFYAFQFEYEGILESNTRPYIAIELGTHEGGSNFRTDEEALAFWDRMLASLKPLPE